MKKIFYIAFAAAALAAVSCAKHAEFNIDPAQAKPGLTITFTCGEMATRAGVDGVNNENRVDKIDYFIFPVVEGPDTVSNDTKPAFSGSINTSATPLEGTYTETVEPGVLGQIFPNGATTAMIFAVANYNGEETLDENLTWQDMHELEVGATFTEDGGTGFGLRWPRAMKTNDPDLFFVMAGDTLITLQTSGEYAIQAEVPLKRLASKVTATFTYQDYLEKKKNKNGEVYEIINWVPQNNAKETRVFLSNAICTTTLGGPLTRTLNPDGGDEDAPWPDRDIFEYAYDFMKPLVDSNKTPYYYTYPFEFQQDGDDNQPYLKLVLPWYGYKYVGPENDNPTYTAGDANWVQYKQKEVYYKIVLPRETLTEPNKIYEYNVTVNIIGSDREVKLIGEEYVVKDWTSSTPVSSNVATGRYISLEIPKDEYDMYVDSISISFVSSGTVIAKIDSIYQWNYSGATPTKNLFMLNDVFQGAHGKGVTATDVQGWVDIPNESSRLVIDHELCNDFNGASPKSKFDAAPYIYVVTLHLEEAGDDTSFDRTITVTQYPAMYIEAETNSAYPTQGSPNYGYVYVNGQQNTTNNNWYLVSGLSGTNSNPNMFIITSTILSDPDMILADPRKATVQNGYNSNDNSWSPEAENIYNLGIDTQLMYYYPTDNSTSAKNMVSPKFRIASSYGKTYPVSRQEAWQRCASYQEDGYPAGRWRVPTTAEVKYVVNLSANGFMDVLFGNPRTENESTNYWTSTGYVTVNNYPTVTEKVQDHDGSPGGNVNVYVRCVYDEWYWDDKTPSKTEFYWGDKLR